MINREADRSSAAANIRHRPRALGPGLVEGSEDRGAGAHEGRPEYHARLLTLNPAAATYTYDMLEEDYAPR